MGGLASLFEPEELVGGWWHRLVAGTGREPHFEEAKVQLADLRHTLEVFFRGLGGNAGVQIRPIPPVQSDFRQRLSARLTHSSRTVTGARFDGDSLFLPQHIAVLPVRSDNTRLYKWLTAFAACADAGNRETHADPLRNDISKLRSFRRITQHVQARFPGLQQMQNELSQAVLAQRPTRSLPPLEAEIEEAILNLLQGNNGTGDIWNAINAPDTSLEHFTAPRNYKPFLPVVLWGEINPPPARHKPGDNDQHTHPDSPAEEGDKDGKTLKARRHASDQIDQKHSLILHRFESILSWTEFMNIPRAVDDDDAENARKAADDSDHIGLTDTTRKAATRLKFDLDLSPQDVDREALAGTHLYPEWDYRTNTYHNNHCRVLTMPAETLEAGSRWQPDEAARRRIRAVKRQFEALRPRRQRLHGQLDGSDLDLDAVVRARCDFKTNRASSNRVFIETREASRDLSVAVLIDTSRSSESYIDGRQVIEVSREALIALATGLAACGDDNALYSFSSLRRNRVMVTQLKGFTEPLSATVMSRIGALKPGFYTRLGAAIRHVSADLTETASAKRLLLVLTDGKPNDMDHYEGRYGIEDTARAVREARKAGNAVFGLTIDQKAQSYFPHIFGRNAYSIATHANHLIRALPLMYRHLTS